MKKKFVLTCLLLTLVLSACSTKISDEALQTAVSEAIMTSSALDASIKETQAAQKIAEAQEAAPSVAELVQLQTELSLAYAKLTEQAGQITDLQTEVEQLKSQATATNTPIPTITETPTITPWPSDTPVPPDRKWVIAVGNAPLYNFSERNAKGYPIMEKLYPVKRFENGEEFLVYKAVVRADGGALFYEVVGPKFAGYYVSVDDVVDK